MITVELFFTIACIAFVSLFIGIVGMIGAMFFECDTDEVYNSKERYNDRTDS